MILHCICVQEKLLALLFQFITLLLAGGQEINLEFFLERILRYIIFSHDERKMFFSYLKSLGTTSRKSYFFFSQD